jgi:spore coat polysaccharide biosynthesis protein SpsF
MTKTIAIIQARMGSSRFPGKPLERIGEWSIVELVLKRVRQAASIDDIVLATSTNPRDTVLAEHVASLGFHVFRGSEDDVLSRFYNAGRRFEATTIARITGDCPLISPTLIDFAVSKFYEMALDYLTINIGEDKTQAFPRGFDVEVAKFAALAEAHEKATQKYEREHVMPYLYTHQDRFAVEYLLPTPDASRPHYRLCVDTPTDLEVVLRIQEFFKEELISADYREIIDFLDKNPEIPLINRTVKQKHFMESE